MTNRPPSTWSRREFLEASAVAAGVSLAPFKFRVVAPSDTVRFGMVGVGMQGSGLLGTASQLPGVTCAAAADLYDGRHTLAKEIVRPDLPTTREYRRLLDDKTIDCIVAAVPDHWHRRMVVEAVSAGKDIHHRNAIGRGVRHRLLDVDVAHRGRWRCDGGCGQEERSDLAGRLTTRQLADLREGERDARTGHAG